MKEPIRGADQEPVSKSERKRQAQALFELGKWLVALPAAQLRRLPLPEQVREAVDEARQIRPRVAHKRQLQFLAKQLRGIDVSAIEDALADSRAESRAEIRRHHRVELWRDRLLADGDRALHLLGSQSPQIDHRKLRQLMRQARVQTLRREPPSAARELFRALRDLDRVGDLPEPS